MRISIVAAVAENGVIGRGGALPWHLSEDLRRFKRLTMGHTIVMGRRTWESIGRPLPGRKTIVVSRQPRYRVGAQGIDFTSSFDGAVEIARRAGEDETFIVGGAELYREALACADRLHITRVHADVAGDTCFPAVDWNQWRLVASERHESDERNDYALTFEVYERAAHVA